MSTGALRYMITFLWWTITILLLWFTVGVIRLINLLGVKSRPQEPWYDKFLLAAVMAVFWVTSLWEK